MNNEQYCPKINTSGVLDCIDDVVLLSRTQIINNDNKHYVNQQCFNKKNTNKKNTNKKNINKKNTNKKNVNKNVKKQNQRVFSINCNNYVHMILMMNTHNVKTKQNNNKQHSYDMHIT